MAASFNRTNFHSCFGDWKAQQAQDLEELEQALSVPQPPEELRRLSQKAIDHFEEYIGQRALMTPCDAPTYMAPPWCSSLEKANLWCGGCRPTISIRLLFALHAFEMRRRSHGGDLPPMATIDQPQMDSIHDLNRRTIFMEEEISAKIAELQEEIGETQVALLARYSSEIGEWNQAVERALDAHCRSMAELVAESDQLRLNTLKTLVFDILTPKQGVEFMAAVTKIHLSVHEWGKRRDLGFE